MDPGGSLTVYAADSENKTSKRRKKDDPELVEERKQQADVLANNIIKMARLVNKSSDAASDSEISEDALDLVQKKLSSLDIHNFDELKLKDSDTRINFLAAQVAKNISPLYDELEIRRMIDLFSSAPKKMHEVIVKIYLEPSKTTDSALPFGSDIDEVFEKATEKIVSMCRDKLSVDLIIKHIKNLVSPEGQIPAVELSSEIYLVSEIYSNASLMKDFIRSHVMVDDMKDFIEIICSVFFNMKIGKPMFISVIAPSLSGKTQLSLSLDKYCKYKLDCLDGIEADCLLTASLRFSCENLHIKGPSGRDQEINGQIFATAVADCIDKDIHLLCTLSPNGLLNEIVSCSSLEHVFSKNHASRTLGIFFAWIEARINGTDSASFSSGDFLALKFQKMTFREVLAKLSKIVDVNGKVVNALEKPLVVTLDEYSLTGDSLQDCMYVFLRNLLKLAGFVVITMGTNAKAANMIELISLGGKASGFAPIPWSIVVTDIFSPLTLRSFPASEKFMSLLTSSSTIDSSQAKLFRDWLNSNITTRPGVYKWLIKTLELALLSEKNWSASDLIEYSMKEMNKLIRERKIGYLGLIPWIVGQVGCLNTGVRDFVDLNRDTESKGKLIEDEVGNAHVKKADEKDDMADEKDDMANEKDAEVNVNDWKTSANDEKTNENVVKTEVDIRAAEANDMKQNNEVVEVEDTFVVHGNRTDVLVHSHYAYLVCPSVTPKFPFFQTYRRLVVYPKRSVGESNHHFYNLHFVPYRSSPEGAVADPPNHESVMKINYRRKTNTPVSELTKVKSGFYDPKSGYPAYYRDEITFLSLFFSSSDDHESQPFFQNIPISNCYEHLTKRFGFNDIETMDTRELLTGRIETKTASNMTTRAAVTLYYSYILGENQLSTNSRVGSSRPGDLLELISASSLAIASHGNGLKGVKLLEFTLNLINELGLKRRPPLTLCKDTAKSLTDFKEFIVPFFPVVEATCSQELRSFSGVHTGTLQRTRNSQQVDTIGIADCLKYRYPAYLDNHAVLLSSEQKNWFGVVTMDEIGSCASKMLLQQNFELHNLKKDPAAHFHFLIVSKLPKSYLSDKDANLKSPTDALMPNENVENVEKKTRVNPWIRFKASFKGLQVRIVKRTGSVLELYDPLAKITADENVDVSTVTSSSTSANSKEVVPDEKEAAKACPEIPLSEKVDKMNPKHYAVKVPSCLFIIGIENVFPEDGPIIYRRKEFMDEEEKTKRESAAASIKDIEDKK